MRSVIIGGTGWTEAYPERVRGDITRMVFSLATQNGYDVMVQGQHWPGSSRPYPAALKREAPEMTPERWAVLMNVQPA